MKNDGTFFSVTREGAAEGVAEGVAEGGGRGGGDDGVAQLQRHPFF